MPSVGIIYGVCGDTAQMEYAVKSAVSAKRVMLDIPCHLWTSLDGPYDGVFDQVHKFGHQESFRPKMTAALESPFDRTLVVDNDTRFLESFSPAFELLDRFDIAAAHAPLRVFGTPCYPSAFAAFNTGVILFRKSDAMTKFIRTWIDRFDEERKSSSVVAIDQLIFSELIYQTELRHCVLPPEFNVRSIFPMFVGGRTTVKLVHGKEPELTRWSECFRRTGRVEHPRVFDTSEVSPMVLGVGLSRTGTTSLNTALQILKYPAVHLPLNHNEIVSATAATDTPVALGYQYLDIMYPGSKFVLTVRRNVDEWLDSCEWLWRERLPNEKDTRVLDFYAKLHRGLYGGEDFDRVRFRKAYFKHLDGVMAYFEGRPEDFLVMDITEGDGWEKLCPFLGKKVPERDFPCMAARAEKRLGGRKRVQLSDELELKMPKLIGNNRVEGLVEMIESIEGFNKLRVLELGACDGASTVEFLRRCRTVHSVDAKIRPDLLSATAQFGNRFSYSEERSLEFLTRWVSEDKPKFDLVYIDTNHEFQNTCNEIEWSLKVIRPGGWISGHDYAFSGTGGVPLNNRGVLRAVHAMLGYPDRVFRDTSWLLRVS